MAMNAKRIPLTARLLLAAAAFGSAALTSLAPGVAGTSPTARVSPAADSAAAGFEVHDDETVYVTAEPDGMVRDVVVVDWLRIDGDGHIDLFDPGEVAAAEALEDDLEPAVAAGGVTWGLDVEGRRDFFYRAETTRELPVAVEVEYELDGVPIDAEEVAGASGHLRIDVTVTNKLERSAMVRYADADGVSRSREATFCVPLLAPVKIDVDGKKFDNIEGEATIISVTGSMRSHTFMAFPQPKATVSIEMDGSDIELDPIVVSVFPKMAGEPDFAVTDQLGELKDGLDGLAMLSEGHYQVIDGLYEGMNAYDVTDLAGASSGFGELAGGMLELEEGTRGLGDLTEGHIEYVNGMIAALHSHDVSQIAALPEALESLADGLGDLKGGVDGIVQLLDGQIEFLDGLAQSNAAMGQAAVELADAASADATLSAMADGLMAGLATQDLMIAALRDGDTDMGLPYGLSGTRTQLAAVSDGLGETLLGIQTLAEGAEPLAMLPYQFEELEAGLVALRDGGVVRGLSMPGLTTASKGLDGIADGLGLAGEGLESAVEQAAPLEDLPDMLAQLQSTLLALKDGGAVEGVDLPGVSTTIDGLATVSDELARGIADSEFGKGALDVMKEDLTEYDSFLGKPDGATGEVRFIIRCDGITKPEEQ